MADRMSFNLLTTKIARVACIFTYSNTDNGKSEYDVKFGLMRGSSCSCHLEMLSCILP